MNASLNIPPTPLPRVVIVGGGFGGVALAKALGNTPYQVVLLDKRNYNTFTPLLYQVATASLEPDSVVAPLREILEKYPNLFFRLTEVTAVVPERNTVQTTRGELAYDYLVIASGSRTNYYHIPGVAEYSMPLKTLPEAMNIRSILLENVEKALTEAAGPYRDSLLTVVVVGGGPTGVEMAGAIAELRRHEFAADYRELDPDGMRVILLEKGPKLLAGMSDTASVKSLAFLRGLGVQVRLHTGLAAYDGEVARLEDGSALPTRCLLFTAGVDANPVPGLAEGVYGKAHRIRVDEHLRVDGYANVFAIGDVAAVTSPSHSGAHPMLAQPAMQQGHYLGKYLKAKLSPRTAPFRYKDLGSLAIVGRNKAVADFSWGRFGGVPAWLLWLGIHLVQLVGFRNRAVVLVNWAISYLGLGKQLRLILRPEPRRRQPAGAARLLKAALVLPGLLPGPAAQARAAASPGLLGQPGIVITLVLILIPLLVAVLFLVQRVKRAVRAHQYGQIRAEGQQLADYLLTLDGEDLRKVVAQQRQATAPALPPAALSGTETPEDGKGLIRVRAGDHGLPFIPVKKKAPKRPAVDPSLARLVVGYLVCATAWLVLGTSAGEYLGIKFVSPDADALPWLSFGRLRPVHTNAVFWGWSSLAMLGLAYYVVPTVSNARIASIRRGWWSLGLINAAVLLGSVCLMAGINNGGGEYREYTWPVMALFGLGLVVTLVNFLQTVARRETREIYISNWYIVSALLFTLTIVVVAYWPTWQNGLGETIIQGYYMHQGVGMWFMLFNLGLVYYFLPQQLNKPIYSYSLGILAFWTQILFYTLIGTHHFVFSSIPWWLQTVAIVGSVGMLIPVAAGTTNFLMTFRGMWHKVGSSYTLPFYVVGIVFYFTGSFQGTAEAFRYTNLLWHFTDFTVAHSHLTMYGIITFLLWASIYAVTPRLTGREAPQATIGLHFWLAFVGLMVYTVPLMIGGTLRGLSWMEGVPFLDSVVGMAPYWLWRAIGGTFMWLSHLVFAYNLYRMVKTGGGPDVKTVAFEELRRRTAQQPLVPTLTTQS
jgi:cytochrome c oxidase cbb3-type subunit 1